MQAGGNTETSKILRGSRRQIQQNIDFILERLDLQQIQNIASRIDQADRVLLLGGDMAAPLVEYMEYHLTIAGLPVVAATSPGRATHLARSTGNKDVAIGISFRRGLRMTIEGVQRAKDNGSYCIGVTDSPLSPLARFADELVIVPINSLSFAASYVAPIALIDLITAGVGSLRRGAGGRPAARGRLRAEARLPLVSDRVVVEENGRLRDSAACCRGRLRLCNQPWAHREVPRHPGQRHQSEHHQHHAEPSTLLSHPVA